MSFQWSAASDLKPTVRVMNTGDQADENNNNREDQVIATVGANEATTEGNRTIGANRRASTATGTRGIASGEQQEPPEPHQNSERNSEEIPIISRFDIQQAYVLGRTGIQHRVFIDSGSTQEVLHRHVLRQLEELDPEPVELVSTYSSLQLRRAVYGSLSYAQD